MLTFFGAHHHAHRSQHQVGLIVGLVFVVIVFLHCIIIIWTIIGIPSPKCPWMCGGAAGKVNRWHIFAGATSLQPMILSSVHFTQTHHQYAKMCLNCRYSGARKIRKSDKILRSILISRKMESLLSETAAVLKYLEVLPKCLTFSKIVQLFIWSAGTPHLTISAVLDSLCLF